MATHSSILAWRIPGTEEPGGPLSMGLHRVGHGWSNLAVAAYPILEDICYWWKLHRLFNIKQFILLQTVNSHFFRHQNNNNNNNPQLPAENATSTYSTIHINSENIAKSKISHQTYCFLYLKLLFLNSMASSPLITSYKTSANWNVLCVLVMVLVTRLAKGVIKKSKIIIKILK